MVQRKREERREGLKRGHRDESEEGTRRKRERSTHKDRKGEGEMKEIRNVGREKGMGYSATLFCVFTVGNTASYYIIMRPCSRSARPLLPYLTSRDVLLSSIACNYKRSTTQCVGKLKLHRDKHQSISGTVR